MPSELHLENQLIKKLQNLGFEYVPHVKDTNSLIENLKTQLEKLNNTHFTENEFKQILNHLNSGDIFDKALTFRDRFVLHRDDDTEKHIIFFNSQDYLANTFQVANQIEQKGPQYLNRYDVTLLINGLPLVQIELKRPGVEMKQAFNQILRYKKHTFSGTLFDFIELFIISDKANTKYFANNSNPKFFHTFYWTDENNKRITDLMDFADAFLNPKFLAEYIYKFIVTAKGQRKLFALRPYQYYASTKILERVKTSDKFGYIWHTTGSGKTLTAFKTAQLLQEIPEVRKVLFVVDRRDLDIQTTQEFNKFSPESVNSTTNTKKLVKQLADNNTKLIVTTLQKLDRALNNPNLHNIFAHLQDQKVVIIFDECHRSQFGKTHANIRRFFKKAQLFGFTGTPIFAQNAVDGKTTAQLFEEALHKYIITNAIDDGNVLGFAVEYIGRFKKADSNTIIDESIETSTDLEKTSIKKAIMDWKRIEKIVDYVLKDLPRKLKVPKDANGNILWEKAQYNALFATSSIDLLRRYYSVFKAKKPHGVKIAAVFTFNANEEDRSDGSLEESIPQSINLETLNKSNREFLEEIIKDYNQTFGTNFSTQNFEEYYQDLQRRIKNREIHLTLVVNMLLTGFDSPKLNTLYVDKNLKYHGLIQAFSRTNRLDGLTKPHGNIVSFRDIKEFVDQALALYGDENAKEVVIGHRYEDIKHRFLQALEELETLLGGLDPQLVDILKGEDKVRFIKIFRKLLRLKASLETFVAFKWEDLKIDEETFSEFISKYKDLIEELKKIGKVGTGGTGKRLEDSKIQEELQQLSFDLELIGQDFIDYDYIIQLLLQLKEYENVPTAYKKQLQKIDKTLEASETWKPRKNILFSFIDKVLNKINTDNIQDALFEYREQLKQQELKRLAKELGMDQKTLLGFIQNYAITGKLPNEYDIFMAVSNPLKIGVNIDQYYEQFATQLQGFVRRYEW